MRAKFAIAGRPPTSLPAASLAELPDGDFHGQGNDKVCCLLLLRQSVALADFEMVEDEDDVPRS
jgi:hypothetical protein